MKRKIIEYITEHPIWSQILACIGIGFLFMIVIAIHSICMGDAASFIGPILMGMLLVYPFVVTLYELAYLIMTIIRKDMSSDKPLKRHLLIAYDMFNILAAVGYSVIYLELMDDVVFDADWNKQLVNREVHAPIYTGSYLTIGVIVVLFFIAMLTVVAISSDKRSPLVTVLCISGMYMGTILVTAIIIQLMGILTSDPLGFFCFLLIEVDILAVVARIIIAEVRVYKPDTDRMSKINSVPFLKKCNELLNDSRKWPLLAFILMWPMLGMVIMILTLFGQAPSSVIKAFTETAEYTFSTKIPPQNLTVDEHYLCTVAAGGHERIVKPIRMGRRHGYPVVVNRQLCVANAFEQILEEKTPALHKAVRGFYDKYGLPVAKLIRTKLVADIVWFLMKPLEYVFLIVLYLTDVHPEDRICRQYM